MNNKINKARPLSCETLSALFDKILTTSKCLSLLMFFHSLISFEIMVRKKCRYCLWRFRSTSNDGNYWLFSSCFIGRLKNKVKVTQAYITLVFFYFDAVTLFKLLKCIILFLCCGHILVYSVSVVKSIIDINNIELKSHSKKTRLPSANQHLLIQGNRPSRTRTRSMTTPYPTRKTSNPSEARWAHLPSDSVKKENQVDLWSIMAAETN